LALRWPWRRRPAASVSVIIPTYNRARSLAALLACLEHQTARELLEVIVCDDGSSDDTSAVAAAFAARLPLRYLFQPDQGFRAGQARNLGIAAARGDLLVFVDDDHLVARDFVANHRRMHERLNRPAVVLGYRYRTGGYDGIPASASAIRRFEPESRVHELGPRGHLLTRIAHPWRYVYTCNMSLSRTAPGLRVDERFTGWGIEDIELGLRLARAGLSVCLALDAPALHLDDRAPRDPFEAERRGMAFDYGSYIRNMLRFLDLHRDDAEAHAFALDQLSYFAFDKAAGLWRRLQTPVRPSVESGMRPALIAQPLGGAAD